jgi:hypothetical protein
MVVYGSATHLVLRKSCYHPGLTLIQCTELKTVSYGYSILATVDLERTENVIG